MSEENKPEVGLISWVDLTTGPAEDVRDFYSNVIGWKHKSLEMGNYSDFIMLAPASGKAIAGVCHARGINKGLPTQWLVYITVENLDESIARCNGSGGKVVFGPKNMGESGRFCVIEDPVGAVAALFEQK